MDFPEIYSPLQELQFSLLKEKKIRVFVKRDDLIHPKVSGNKFRKLKYNLLQASKEGKKQILTFGGAYSNHIAATAAACKMYGFESIGIIRGDEFQKLNYTLQQAQNDGMQLHFTSRKEYKLKEEYTYLEQLRKKFGDFYCIPEGGSNLLAVKGCSEIVSEIKEGFDYIAVPCGTGTTLAGIYSALKDHQTALGFSALKAGGFLHNEVERLLEKSVDSQMKVITDYHFGGYAKIKPELLNFVNRFYEEHRIPLDLIYTAKMFFGIMDRIANNHFPPNKTIVVVHTGGLQGNKGMMERYKINLEYC